MLTMEHLGKDHKEISSELVDNLGGLLGGSGNLSQALQVL